MDVPTHPPQASEQAVIILAGGVGKRFGSGEPKQFALLAGRAVLLHTLEAFAAALPRARLILVCERESMPRTLEILQQGYSAHASTPVEVVPGGANRTESMRQGYARIRGFSGVVAIHDAARPLVSAELIQRCMEAAAHHGSAIPTLPVVESLRRVDAQGGSVPVDRSAYHLVQTPQCFRGEYLDKVSLPDDTPGYSDDATLVETLGLAMTLVEGERSNLKITTAEDLLIAEALLAARRQC